MKLLIGFVVALSSLGAVASSNIVLQVGANSPYPTLQKVLNRVAEIRQHDTQSPLEVQVGSGDYLLERGIEISPKHAATNFAPLVFRAVDLNLKPRLLGGVALTNWKLCSEVADVAKPFVGRSDVWCASAVGKALPKRVRLLLCNGKRMQPARWPNRDLKLPYTTGYAFADARGFAKTGKRFSNTGLFQDEIQIRPEDERTWSHPEDAWVIVHPRHNWWNVTYDITNVANGVCYVKNEHKEITDRLFPWDRWCVENMAEELDLPGEWYFDSRSQQFYFKTPDGSNPNLSRVTVAQEGAILTIRGSNVVVEGFDVACGLNGISVNDAHQVSIRACDVHDIGFHGGNGIYIHGHNIQVTDCNIAHIGSHGICVSAFWNEQHVHDRLNVLIENNYVHHTGEINSHGIGIMLYGQGIKVRHNLIHDTPRCGLFGYGRFCEISYNRVRHTNTTNDDTGAIYGGGWTGGIGTHVCYNWFSDSIGFQRQQNGTYRLYKGACGIYPDEGCGGLEVYGNIVEHCHHVAMHLHNGRWITISNNVFISNGALPAGKSSAQLSLQTWNNDPNGYFVHDRQADIAKEYHRLIDIDKRWLDFPALAQAPDNETTFNPDGTTMMGIKVVNNIVAYPDQGEGSMLRGWNLNTQTNYFNNNVYWPGQTTNVYMIASLKAGCDWKAWQGAGEDKDSVIADPQFQNPEARDYRLKPDSIAFKLGFKELPYDKMGLQKTKLRPTLPKEEEGLREHPEWLKVN